MTGAKRINQVFTLLVISIFAGCSPEPTRSDAILVAGEISDAERQKIVFRRVESDAHGLADVYPDKSLRTILELIAADSGIHPKQIPLDRPLMRPPVSFDEIALIELVISVEDVFGTTMSDQELDAKGASLTPRDLLELSKRQQSNGERSTTP